MGGVAGLGVALAVLAWYGSSELIRRRPPDVQASPTDYNLPFENVTFKSTDRVTLRGWFIQASPACGTVVFCHGHAGSMDPDLQYAPWFHAAGFNVLMFDFRGHGRSEGQHVSMGYLERYDLLGALDFLSSQGIRRVGVLGFSLGGAVAISTAALSRNIAAVVSDGGFAELRRTLARGIRERYPLGPVCDWLAWLIVRMSGWRLGVNLTASDPIRWVGQVSPTPLLLIHGGQDPYVSVEDVQRLHARAGEPKELWIVPEAGHRQVDQVHPEGYRQRILDFFERYLR
jgi:fermentation-respiration switch protein FrsA (DUF1100 family)